MYPYEALDRGDLKALQIEMTIPYIGLRPEFSIKADQDKVILHCLKRPVQFELDPDQADLVTQLDGTKTANGIVAEYDEGSKDTVREFLVNLAEAGAIEERPRRREIKIVRVKSPRLEMVHFEPYSKCNMFCIHCYQGERYNRKKDNLTLAEMKNLILQMKELQVSGISISGGEPFVDLEIMNAARFCEENGIRVQSFFTNGTLITEELVRELRALKSHPTFFVSFDGDSGPSMNFRSFDNAKGEEAVKKIIGAIRLLAENGFSVVVNTVLNCCNELNLIRMYDLISTLGVRSWRVGYPKRTGNFSSKDYQGFEVRFKDMWKICFDLLRHHIEQGKPMDLQIEYLYREALLKELKELPDDAYVCDYEGRRESCCIKPNGDVVACAYCCDHVIGNVKQQPLSEIWYSEAMRAVKNLRIKDIEECKDCELRQYCATGCRANACFMGGEFAKSKDPYACEAVKFFVEVVKPRLECLL
jgi:radical SAM protein with 4Fe4S-binding SPASM domain